MKRVVFLSASLSLLNLALFSQEDFYYEAGLRAVRDGRDTDAISYFEESYQKGSQNPDLYLALSLLYQKTDQPTKAITLLKEGLQKLEAGEFILPEGEETAEKVTQERASQGVPNATAKTTPETTATPAGGVEPPPEEQSPKGIDYRSKFEFNLANNYFSTQEVETAISLYDTLLAKSLYTREIHLNRGNAYLEQKSYGLAADDYETYLRSFTPEETPPEQKEELEELIPKLRRLSKTQGQEPINQEDLFNALIRTLHGLPATETESQSTETPENQESQDSSPSLQLKTPNKSSSQRPTLADPSPTQ